MEEIANLIFEIKSRTDFKISEVGTILEELNERIRNILINRINKLEIPKEYFTLISLFITNWRYPIKWEIKSILVTSSIINANKELCIPFDIQHQLLIFNDVNEIESSISSIIDKIKAVCNERLAKFNERVILNKLHEFYMNLPTEDGDDLKKIIAKCFHVKYVNCENGYANRDYFESYKSDVTIQETRYCAMVSTIDDSCIEKGVYLYPIKK